MTIAGRGTSEINFYALVNRVADEFQQSSGLIVNPDARNLLVSLAMPYTAHVQEELIAGSITREFLVESIFTLFRNAYEIAYAQDRNYIDVGIVQLSMARYCPYLFWC
jgi:hypothetical protein